MNEWSTLLVRRANLHNGCVTEMYGSIQLIDDQQITITTSTTDGKCELPVDFHTNIQLDKRDANLLTGAWLRPNILLHIRVSGALTRGELYTAGFTHTLSGTYDATTARSTLVVTRSNLRNGCVTELHGMIGILNPKQIAITITKTDGRCDLPTGFHDYSTYTREERPCASFQSTPCLSRGCVGRTRCDNSASPPVICSPQQEECNGLDDNCDGKIDENDICLASSACD